MVRHPRRCVPQTGCRAGGAQRGGRRACRGPHPSRHQKSMALGSIKTSLRREINIALPVLRYVMTGTKCTKQY